MGGYKVELEESGTYSIRHHEMREWVILMHGDNAATLQIASDIVDELNYIENQISAYEAKIEKLQDEIDEGLEIMAGQSGEIDALESIIKEHGWR